jgi:hypothetical protein
LATTNITTTTGSSTATVADPTNIAKGQFIYAPGMLPSGTYLTADPSGSTITLAKWVNGVSTPVTPIAPGTMSATFGTTYTDVFQHCMYLAVHLGNTTVRRNLAMDPSSHGVQARSGGQVYHNAFLRCALGILGGGGVDYGRTYPGAGAFYFSFTGNPTAGDTITLTVGAASTTYTFVASGATGNQINIGADRDTTVNNAVAAINASTTTMATALKAGPSYAGIAPGVQAIIDPPNNLHRLDVCYNPAFNGDAQLNLTASSSAIIANPRSFGSAHYEPDPGDNATVGHRPSGVDFDVHHNLLLHPMDINSALARGQHITGSNGKATAKVRQNLMLGAPPSGTGTALAIESDWAQPTYYAGYRNVSVGVGTPSGDDNGVLASFSSRILLKNVWDRLTSGTNVNNTGYAFPSARSESDIIAAVSTRSGLSFTDLDGMRTVAIEHPEKNWAQYCVEESLPGYGIDLNDAVVIYGTSPTGRAGIAYSFVPSVVGGNGTYSFAWSGDALPTGLSINATTGEISGTTSSNGTYNGTITVSSGGTTDTLPLALLINPLGYSTEATNLFTAAVSAGSAAFDDSDKIAIDDCILALKAAVYDPNTPGSPSAWSLIDYMLVTCLHDRTASTFNWISPGTYTASDPAPTTPWTKYRGFIGNGTSQYLNSGLSLSTATNFKQDNCTFLIWAGIDVNSSSTYDAGGKLSFINSRNIGLTRIAGMASTVTDVTLPSADGRGCTAFTRDSSVASGQFDTYKNGAKIATTVKASAAPTNFPVYILAANNGGTFPGSPTGISVKQTRIVIVAGPWSAYQHGQVYNALNALMTHFAGRS